MTDRLSRDSAEPPRFDIRSIEGVPWLADLLEKPSDAAWPRHMTPIHPDATGSYGADLERWVRAQLGIELRWWQRLAVRRQLEHDREGVLVWQSVLESTPRRAGKSVRLRCGALWRVAVGADLFGEEQFVLHTGKDLPIAKEIHRRAWPWAAAAEGWSVRRMTGNEELEAPDGSRWAVRGRSSLYGYDVTYGMVDEAWGVEPAAVDEGLEPSLLERLSPQLLLTSTAHRQATPLMRRRITAALNGMGEDWSTLLMLWGAGPDDPLGDPDVWRAASPHWSNDRQRLIAGKYERAMRGEADPETEDPDPLEGFRAQYLNVWPSPHVTRVAGTVLLDAGAWDRLQVPSDERVPAVVAVESWFGGGISVAAARLLEDETLVSVEVFAELGAASARIKALGAPVLLAGKSLAGLPELTGAEPMTGTSRAVIAGLERLVADHAFVHDGSPVLAEQVLGLRTEPGPDGPRVISKGRMDAVKAAVWAVQRARTAAERPAVF